LVISRIGDERFHSLIDNIPDVVWTSDSGGKTVYISPNVERLYGFSPDEIYQGGDQLWLGRIHPDDVERVQQAYESLLSRGEVFDVEYRIQRKDGHWIWLHDRAIAAYERDGVRYADGIFSDITARKRAEEALRESNEALRKERIFASTVLDTVGALVVVLDREGRIVRFNQACESTTGYSFNEVRGKYVWELFLVPEEVEPVRAVFRELRSGQFPNQHENHWVTKDGTLGLIAWTNTALLDGEGAVEYVIGTGVDITERKRAEAERSRHREALREAHDELERRVEDRTAELVETNTSLEAEIAEREQTEEALRLSELRFRSLIEQTSDAVFCYEYDPPIPTGLPIEEQIKLMYGCVLAECNDVCARSYGATRAKEVLGRELTDLFGTAPNSLDGLFRELIEGGYRVVDGLGTEVLKDGTKHYYLNNGHGVVENGKLARVWGTYRDITERVRAEQALRKSEERFYKAFHSSPDPVTITTLDKGRFVEASEAIVRVAGYTPEEVVGKTTAELEIWSVPEDRARMVELLKNQGRIRDLEITILHKSGERRDCLLSAETIELDGERCLVAVTRDITERVRTEKALQRRNRELELLNRAGRVLNATLDPDQVLAAVLEEVRALLGVVACSIWLVERGTDELVCRQASGPGNEVVRGWRLAPGEGLVGWVAQSGESLVVPDAQADERHFQGIDEQTGVALRSILGVPLQVQQKTIGVLLAMDTEPDRFDATDLRLLESLAASASAAIENARLHQETARRLGEAQAIGAVATGLTRSLDVDQVLTSIVDAATHLIPASTSGVLHLVNESGDRLIPRAALPPKVTAAGKLEMSVGEGIAGLVTQEKRTINVPDVERDPRFLVADTVLHQSALLTTPLLIDEECIGTLSLNSDRTGAFSPDDERVLTTLAAQAAVAVRNARLHEQIRHHAEDLERRVADRTRELSALYKVSSVASESLDLQTTLDRVLENVLVAMQCTMGGIHLLDEDGQTLRLTTYVGVPLAQIEPQATLGILGDGTPLTAVVERGQPMTSPNFAADTRDAFRLVKSPLGPWAGVPIRVAGQTDGVLSVAREAGKSPFVEEDVDLLATIADQAGAVIESARLRERAEQAVILEERQRLARDLHDSVTQSLYSLTLLTEAGQRMAKARDLERVEENLARLSDLAQQVLQEIRLMLYELRPLALRQEGLMAALKQRLTAVEQRAGVIAHLVTEDEIDLPPDVEEEAYRIAQEALNNALKHAHAYAVTVAIRREKGLTTLEVTDDGRGFDLKAVRDQGGLGLVSMRERAEKLGGVLRVISAPGEGTTVRASFPRDSKSS
jgi:PAS domain S-box-containing protein